MKLKITDWIEWTPDCQGKQDFDGELIHLSTRYWPAGGSAHILDTAKPELGLQPLHDPAIKPHAHAAIYIGGNAEHKLAERDFKADTEAEVKALVETWAQQQFDQIVSNLLSKEWHISR